MPTNLSGTQAEDLAARFLRWKGWEVLTRNQHQRFSEFDILARDTAGNLVVVEVKSGKNPLVGFTPRKCAKLRKACQEAGLTARIDGIAINTTRHTLRYLENLSAEGLPV